MSIGGIAAGFAGNVLSAGLERNWNKRDAERDRTFEREMVGRQEEFQERSATTAFQRSKSMSDTSFQRSMADMKKAGLNPMLAYQKGGASTPPAASPSGAKGSAPGTKPTKLDLVASASRGQEMMLTRAQIEVTKADVRMKDSQTDLNSAKALQVAEADIPKIKAQTIGQITENEIRALKKVQRETTGDSALGRWITTVLRTGKMGYREFKKLMAATHKMGRRHRAAALKFLDKHGFHVERKTHKSKTKYGRFDYGKANNKKTIRRKYTRRDGGPR